MFQFIPTLKPLGFLETRFVKMSKLLKAEEFHIDTLLALYEIDDLYTKDAK